MRKIILYTSVVIAIVTLINCSPKTVKNTTTTAKEVSKSPSREEKEINGRVNDEVVDKTVAKRELTEDEKAMLAKQDNQNNFINLPFERQMAIIKGTPNQRVSMGKQLYENSCGKCHKLYDPTSRNMQGWMKVMAVMSPKAKLTEANCIMISAYLNTLAK